MAVDATSAQPQILPDIIAILKTITIAIIMTRKMPHCLNLQAGVFEARLSHGSQMKIDSGLKMEEFYNMRRILSRKREMKMNSIDPIISRSQASWSRTVRPPRFPPSCPPSPPPPPLR